ncbi:hypothetical protein IMZ48_09800 [Candidatus Bathyarchaeota archaeon]|nr:hypothetical protein [Candidatus Bathyarchaeota archaeon]
MLLGTTCYGSQEGGGEDLGDQLAQTNTLGVGQSRNRSANTPTGAREGLQARGQRFGEASASRLSDIAPACLGSVGRFCLGPPVEARRRSRLASRMSLNQLL